MVYALWDIETNNLVAEYRELDEALSLVLRGIDRNGSVDTDTLALEVEDDHGDVTTLAQGRELANLARQKLQKQDRLAH